MRRGVLLEVSEAEVLVATIEDLCRRTGRQPSGRLGPIVAKMRKVVANTGDSDTKTASLLGNTADSGQSSAYDLVTTGEAARIIGCTPNNVRDLRRRGQLPAHHTGTRWLYPLRMVEARAERQAAHRIG